LSSPKTAICAFFCNYLKVHIILQSLFGQSQASTAISNGIGIGTVVPFGQAIAPSSVVIPAETFIQSRAESTLSRYSNFRTYTVVMPIAELRQSWVANSIQACGGKRKKTMSK